jgi:Asp-tRNA(Asn)/Glu-tRNA(Gln) amidotransferase A subunit family amidase
VTEVEVLAAPPAPAGLLDAFWAYDRALLANDTGVLAELFAPGPDTLRADGGGVLVGHERITAFRGGRTAVPTRRVSRVHVRPFDAVCALVMAETRTPDGSGAGLQTQLWRVVAGRWQVCAAHVTPPGRAPIPDRSVWRVRGEPLVPGASDGSLRGRSVAVKDVFAVRGYPVGAGNPTWLEQAPAATEHADAVSALVRAGASVAGIARTDEFAYSLAGTNAHYGTPPNPAAPDRVPGGSSNGPASAVALGGADIGLGTDTAGSIRVPASYQGLFGLRSTHGLLDLAGMLGLAPSFDTVGWLTRDAVTLAAVVDAVLPVTSTAARTPLTRGVLVPAVTGLAEASVRSAFTAAVTRLVEDGVLDSVQSMEITPDVLARWCEAFRTVQGHEAWSLHGPWVTAHPGALGVDVAGRFAAAAAIDAASATEARRVVNAAGEALRALLSPGTALLLPSASSAAPSRNSPLASPAIERARAATLRLTCLAGLAGVPAISIPLAGVDGAPVGISVLAAPGADLDLTDLAVRASRSPSVCAGGTSTARLA